jgi:PhnB protein
LEADNGFTLMASDTAPGTTHTQGDNVCISLSGDDAEELRGYWKHLSDAGTVAMPLEKQMWGDEYGQCTDQYGLIWMVNIAQPQG